MDDPAQVVLIEVEKLHPASEICLATGSEAPRRYTPSASAACGVR
jgi:hypothetical protein